MGGAHLLACMVLIGAVSGQPCPIDCGTYGMCAQHTDGQFFCDCMSGFFGASCTDTVCSRMMTMMNNVPFCKLNTAGNCTGDLADGRLCSCPAGRTGVLCELPAASSPLTLCQRRDMLNTFILALLDNSIPLSETSSYIRQVMDSTKLKELLREVGMQQVVRYQCDDEGRFQSSQCEVDIDSNVEQCYCVDQDSGKMKTGYTKMASRPSNCDAPATGPCEMAPEAGSCEMVQPRWFFNRTSSKCEMFTYGGCYGNKNNFETVDECYNTCANYSYPCAAVTCMVGSVCTVVPDDVRCQVGKCRHSPSCLAVGEKHGLCPNTTGMMGTCVERCSSDSACPDQEKCCSNGCGHVCMPPAQPPHVGEKTGICPNTTGMMGICSEMCSSDSNCPDREKCCSNGCGHVCMQPAHVPPVVKPGQCMSRPTPPPDGQCIDRMDQCRHDGECDGNHKCCMGECEMRCMPPAAPMVPAECTVPPVPKSGVMCLAYIPRFFYNTSTAQCETFIYGGCRPTTNHFMTAQHCYEFCNEDRNPCNTKNVQCAPGSRCSLNSTFVQHTQKYSVSEYCAAVTYQVPKTNKLAIEWLNEYSDPDSMEAKFITRALRSSLTAKYTGLPNFLGMVMGQIQPGSVVVPYTLQFSQPLNAEGMTRLESISGEIVQGGLDVLGVKYHSTEATECVIPDEYTGMWYSRHQGMNIDTMVYADKWNAYPCQQIQFENKPLGTKGVNSTLILSKSDSCFVCTKVMYRTPNVLQLQESNCFASNMGVKDMCQGMEQQPVQTLFKNDMMNSECGLEGFYQYSYELQYRGGAVCDHNNNTIAVTKKHSFTINFAQCEGNPASMATNMTFNCLGSWSAEVGGIRYKFAAVVDMNTSVPNQERYRCMMTQENGQMGEERWVMSQFATCTSLYSLNNAPIKLMLRKREPPIKQGRCPKASPSDNWCFDGCTMDMSCAGSKKCCGGCCKEPMTGPITVPDKCKASPHPPSDSFGCFAYIPRWFYNDTTSRCEKYIYGGCQPSTNDFSTPQECYSACNEAVSPCVNSRCGAGSSCRVEESDSCPPEGPCETLTNCYPSHCSLEPETGPCRMMNPQWFYNSSSNTCHKFIYGGCRGNNNKFPSAHACFNECAPRVNPCRNFNCATGQRCVVKEQENCNRGACSSFAKCEALPAKCYKPPLPPPGSLVCEAYIPRWFFNSTTSKCEQYIWGGCNASVNDFDSASQCYQECPITVPDKCKASPHPPSDSFGCLAYIPRWFYNDTTARCEKYIYGGCQPSTNDFSTPQECYSACNDAVSPCMNTFCGAGSTCRVEESDSCPSEGPCETRTNCYPSHCSLEPETGPCRMMNPQWFYNSSSNTCHKFIYGGCRGNNNKFPSAHACFNECAPRVNPCRNFNCATGQRCVVKEQENCTRGACSSFAKCEVVTRPGECPTYDPMMQVEVSECTDTCSDDIDCYGNMKCCFHGCSKTCVDPEAPVNPCGEGRMMCHSVKKCVSLSVKCDGKDDCGDGSDELGCPGTLPAKCYKSPLPPPGSIACRAYIPRWFFNSTTSKCEQYIWGGCHASVNDFDSASQCYQECPVAVPEKCKVSPLPSTNSISCRAYMPRWFYNVTTARCEKYIYGGCGHTSNHFSTPQECYSTCNEARSPCMNERCKFGTSCRVREVANCNGLNCSTETECHQPHCLMPPDQGPCRAMLSRWYFNNVTNTCEKFTYGGCRGNMNKFESAQECFDNCAPKASPCHTICPLGGNCTLHEPMNCQSGPCTPNVTCHNTTCTSHYDCANGGTCWEGSCMCAPGYFGRSCHQQRDPCASMPCQNGGTCKTPYNRDNYTCSCPPNTSGQWCERRLELAECRNLYLTNTNGFTDVITHCMNILVLVNDSALSTNDMCKLYQSVLGCGQEVMRSHGVGCSYLDLHKEFEAFTALMDNSQMPSGMGYAAVSMCAGSVPTRNETVARLCSDGRLITTVATATMCMSTGISSCSMLGVSVGCLKMYTKCTASFIRNSLITHANILINTYNTDFSGCERSSGMIYKYNGSVRLNMPWTNDLYDSSTLLYKSLKSALENSLEAGMISVEDLERIVITSFSQGSVRAMWTGEFIFPVTAVKKTQIQAMLTGLEGTEVYVNDKVYTFITTAAVKPGECPMVTNSTVTICSGANCTSDTNCSGVMKCCYNTCGSTCQYPTNTTGGTCASRYDCHNGGTCYEGRCLCSPGYYGTNCNQRKDPCASMPCKNNGSCITPYHHDNYTCDCPSNTRGERCEMRVCDLFVRDLCKGMSSFCQGNLNSGELCWCEQGRGGLFCEQQGANNKWGCEKMAEFSNYVQLVINGQTMPPFNYSVVSSQEDFLRKANMTSITIPTCSEENPTHFTSPSCDMDVYSRQKSCYCVDRYGSEIYGTRKPSYLGEPDCRNPCEKIECLNNGVCYLRNDSTVGYCRCPQGFMGDSCQFVGDVCDSNPCANGFACERHYDGGYRCNCSVEWGPNCTNVPPQYCTCSPWQKCVWYENCSSGGCHNKHKCVGNDYDGPCDRGMPCGKNGRCVERGGRDYKCLCDGGFSGAHCTVNDLVCRELGPVRYRICGLGRCVGDIERGELCRCPSGRKGAFCEMEGEAVSLCERQNYLYHAAMEVINGTRSVPDLQNASSVVMQITRNVMGLREVPLVTCTPTGDFTPQQCAVDLDSYVERCYCVDNMGEEIYQNITVLPGQPPCTAPDPKDIGKLLCEYQEEGGLCLNGGSCVGEIDGTPRLCVCPEGYEGLICERRTQQGDYPEQYTMCMFTLDLYKLMMSVINGSISLQMQGVTVDKKMLTMAYHQMIMAHSMPRPQPMYLAWNTTTTMEQSLLMPNCTRDGHFNSLQCEYGLETGARHVCYCFSESGRMIKGTRTMPPDYPMCDNVTDVCEPMPCSLDCPMGLRKNMLGCDICQCKEKCDGKMCPHGTRCHASGHCRPTHKKGMCPVEMMPTMDSLMRMFEDTMDSCEMLCKDDADCDGDLKCCGTCGNRCVQPYIPANCEEKRNAMNVHWNLHQNLSAMLEDRNIEQSMGNYSYPAVLHSAIQWVQNTRIMWKPACDSEGGYERVQCMFDLRSGSRDHCFCSDSEGRRINGTDRRPPMEPECTEKPGYCPMELMTMMPPSNCAATCEEDYDCSGHDKCCTSGCRSVCQPPVNDTILDHTETVAGLFSRLCSMMGDQPVCYHGSECVSDWHSATMCDCPVGYKGALCQTMMEEDEEAPSKCERRRAIYETITDAEFVEYKTMILGMLQLDTVIMNRANCSGGDFTPTQCDYDINNKSRKWCYCVNKTGDPIPGTRVPGDRMPQCGAMQCDAGHPLYRPDHHDTMHCDKHRRCPSGYECKPVAYGQSVCCISSEGHQDICRLAASPGKWCEGESRPLQMRYAFNATLGKCMPFSFRGCHGNKNAFMTENECERRCVKKDKEGTCPKASLSLNSRYCHNSCEDDSTCQEDKKCCDTGCGRKCVMPKRDDSDRVCKLGLQYTYENGSSFYCGRGQSQLQCPNGYTCDVDPLDRASFCCPDEDKPVNVCHQPKQTGPCKAAMPRYFFNRLTDQCEKFTYGGCQGNDNNFESLEECCLRCGSEDGQCKPGSCPNPTKNYLLPCQDMCESDKSCLGNTRCCYNGCGKECILTVNMTTNCHTMLKKAHMMLQQFKEERKCPMIVIPRCNRDGTWQSQQCLDGFGICWCVDAQGQKIADSMVRGHAHCPKYPAPPRTVALSMENDAELMSFQVCPQDTRIHCCHPSLCQLHTCPAHPSAVCRVNPCNGCQVEFFNKDNNVVNCTQGLSSCEVDQHRAKTLHSQNLFNQMPEFSDRLGNFTQRMMEKMMPEPEKPAVIPAICQTLPGKVLCSDALEVKWFYNYQTNRCEKFGYSGCGENLNRFNTVEECYQGCNPEADPCKMRDCGEGRECHLAVDPECFTGKCAHWAECRYAEEEPHLSGVNIPTCSHEGYARKQCHHGYCWCVDRKGKPQENTLALEAGLICNKDGTRWIDKERKLECSSNNPPKLRCMDACLGRVCRGRPHAVCVVNLCSDSCDVKFMEGAREVECDTEETCEVMYAEPPSKCTVRPIFCEEGAFPKLCADKCKDVTCPGNPCAVCKMDQCSCQPVFEDMLTGERVTDCKLVTHTRCEMSQCWRMKERDLEMLLSGESTVVVPTCTASGHYQAKQCDSKRCWCVDGLGSFLSTSSKDDWCRWNETVKVEIRGMKFNKSYSLIQGKEKGFIRALKSEVKSLTGVPDAEKFITEVRVYQGSIMVDMVLEGEKVSDMPPPEVPIMADIIQRKISEGEMTVEFENQEYTAERNSETFSRTDRFEQAPTRETQEPEPEPEAEPGLQRHEIIIIAVVSSIAGVVLLGVLIKCCCCRRNQKDLPNHQPPPPLYVNSEKPYPPPNMAVSNATYGMIGAPMDNLAYSSETDVIKKPISDNLEEGDFIKVRL